MKKAYIFIVLITTLVSCNSEDAPDCFKKAGKTVSEIRELPEFTKITAYEGIALTIKEGPVQKVEIVTGENLISGIETTVVDGRLELFNTITCNYVRDYGITKVHITSPNLTEVRSSTQYTIKSDGVLTYPDLKIISSRRNPDFHEGVGDFDLKVDIQNFSVSFGNISNCFIEGQVENLNIGFVGNCRFEGKNLIAKKVKVRHTGTNDIVIYPTESLTGVIKSYGNVVVYNRPPVVEVEELLEGRVIFKD